MSINAFHWWYCVPKVAGVFIIIHEQFDICSILLVASGYYKVIQWHIMYFTYIWGMKIYQLIFCSDVIKYVCDGG